MNLCIAKFEELEPFHVATALDGFFKRYVTYIILFADSIPSSSHPFYNVVPNQTPLVGDKTYDHM